MDNEPNCTWNGKMRTLLQDMIHYRNGLPPGTECSEAKVTEFEAGYDEALQTAEEEYRENPPNEYYKDGYNLYMRMNQYRHNHLLFLHDCRVPATNNEAERLLRRYKRKQVQAVSFRSQESLGYLCECMGMLIMIRKNEEENLFERVSRIFG